MSHHRLRSVILGIALVGGVAGAQAIYWSELNVGQIRRANLDGTNQVVLVSSLTQPTGMGIDRAGGKIYWARRSSCPHVQRSNLDGSNVEQVVGCSGYPEGLIVDPAGGKVYWAGRNDHVMRRSNLDGTMIEDIVPFLDTPSALALDGLHGWVYWSDSQFGTIERAELDGSNRRTVVAGRIYPLGVAVDPVGGKIFYNDGGTSPELIYRANLDGTQQEIIIDRGIRSIYQMTVDPVARKLYWTDIVRDHIQRSDLDGGQREVVLPNLRDPWGIAIDPGPGAPAPACTLTGSGPGPIGGDIAFTVTAGSPNAPAVDITFDFSTDGGASWRIASPALGAFNPIRGAPVTVPRPFSWDTVGDGVGLISPIAGVLLRATIDDGMATASCIAPAFAVDNSGGAPGRPSCTAMLVSMSPVAGDASFDLMGDSSQAVTVSMTVEYSTDSGLSYRIATPAPGSSNPLSGVAVRSPASFDWDTVADGVGSPLAAAGVLMRVTVDDGSAQANCFTGAFTVDNSAPPPPMPGCSAILLTPSPLSGSARFVVVPDSPSAPTVDLEFDYTLDGGVSWNPATPAPGSTNPIQGAPIQMSTIFEWDTVTDGAGVASLASNVRLRVSVDDGVARGACLSAPFDIDNQVTPPPSCMAALISPTPIMGVADLVVVGDSPSSPTLSITFDYSTDGGISFQLASPDPASSNPLVGAPVLVTQSFGWDSRADGVGTGAPAAGVLVRATVDDGVATGSCLTAPFDVDNQMGGGGGSCMAGCGDCNDDGSAPTILDSLTAAQVGVGVVVPTMAQSSCCDVNASGMIDVIDALLLAQAAAGAPIMLTCP